MNFSRTLFPPSSFNYYAQQKKNILFYIYETIYEPNMASDFVSEVVRDKLKATKVIKTRDIDYEEVKVYQLD